MKIRKNGLRISSWSNYLWHCTLPFCRNNTVPTHYYLFEEIFEELWRNKTWLVLACSLHLACTTSEVRTEKRKEEYGKLRLQHPLAPCMSTAQTHVKVRQRQIFICISPIAHDFNNFGPQWFNIDSSELLCMDFSTSVLYSLVILVLDQ